MVRELKFFAICAVVLSAAQVEATDGELIGDGGIESSEKLSWSRQSAALQRVGTDPHSGKWCLHVLDDSDSAIGHAQSKIVPMSLRGGGRFYAEIWARVDTEVGSRTGYASVAVQVAFFDSAGKLVATQAVGRTSSARWTRLSALITLPDEASRAALRIFPASTVPQLRGAAFADDVYFAPLPDAQRADRVKLAAAPQPPEGAAEYEPRSEPTDGANLALSIDKLTHGFDPPRPFVIWAIGSSFTEFLGSGDELISMIRDRFPHAPPIVYKTMVGGSTPYNLLRGWARHLVIPDRPDLVLVYNFGSTDGMEKLLDELREHTTADIIVPTLHWCADHQAVWPDPEADTRHLSPAALRELCRRRGVEFVENRRQITRYMLDNKLQIADLLVDTVHQSPYAAKIINTNIAGHFQRPQSFGYDARTRERRNEAEDEASAVSRTGDWHSDKNGQALTGGKGTELTVEFTGTGIDLIGWHRESGGRARLWIDGTPADEAPVFHATYVQPAAKNYIDLKSREVDYRRVVSDRCPHGVTLGKNLIPQNWTITMTGSQGDFQLVGSTTGPDGSGNAFQPFTSSTGQIIIEPELWRLAGTNRAGDQFTFQIERSSRGEVDFAGDDGKFRVRLIDDLPNGRHTLRLQAAGPGTITVDAFDVFQPPELDASKQERRSR